MSLKRSSSAQRASFRSLRKKFIAGASASVLALGALVGFAGPVSAAPAFATPDATASATAGTTAVVFTANATDATAYLLGFTSRTPAVDGYAGEGFTIDSSSGAVTMAGTVQEGEYVFFIEADDGTTGATQSLTITVSAAPVSPPTIGSLVITGDPIVGGQLEAEFSVTGDPEVSIQWKADGVPIDGADELFFTVTEDEYSLFISVTVTAENSGGSVEDTSEETSAIVFAAVPATFGAATSTADGFTVQITNFADLATFTLGATVPGGTATIGETGLVTVTGLTAGAEATLTVTSTKAGFATGTGTKPGTATAAAVEDEAAVVATFGAATSTADGFTVQITNFADLATFTLGATVPGGTATIGETGLVTVTGLTAGAEATLTVTSTKAGFATGTGTKPGTATAAAPVVSSPTPSAGGGAIVAPPVQAPAPTPAAAPQTTRTEAFAANSAKLSKDLRVSIREALASNPNAKSAVCRGFVASGTATAADRKLARDRSTAVCNLITKLNPDLDVEVKKVVVASSSQQLRKVRIVLR
jgi:titin